MRPLLASVRLLSKTLVPLGVLALAAPLGLTAATIARTGPAPDAPSQVELQIGDTAPDFNLPGIDGKNHTLATYGSAKLLLIAFLSNHCPDSNATTPRLIQFAKQYAGKVQVVGINPNNPDGVSVDELGYTSYSDGFEDMKRYSSDLGFVFPYLYDGDTQKTAVAYGCLCTPHVFLFDADRKLRYKGQFDDSNYADPASVKTTDTRNAVDDLLAGRPVAVPETKPHGCSTKWLAKKANIAKKTQQWESTPVELVDIDQAGVKELLAKPDGRMRLYNVWATWCKPCVEEFPGLVQIQRRFSQRHFDLITLSVDSPQHAGAAKAFLEKQGVGMPAKIKAAAKSAGRTTNSFLYRGSMSELLNTLDPKWPGGIPHTVLVSGEGKILWRHNGMVTEEEVREKILEHLGRTFIPGVDR
jgi:thiol-disulfide isomerase/thioredoxin